MIIDANLLILASNQLDPDFGRAKDWLIEQFNGRERVGLPWESLLAFLRVTTNPRAFPSQIQPVEAWGRIDAWLGLENVWVPQPTEGHAQILGRLIVESGATGNLVMDAHLAAIAIGHGNTLYSRDSDFAKFPGLRWVNPLAVK